MNAYKAERPPYVEVAQLFYG